MNEWQGFPVCSTGRDSADCNSKVGRGVYCFGWGDAYVVSALLQLLSMTVRAGRVSLSARQAGTALNLTRGLLQHGYVKTQIEAGDFFPVGLAGGARVDGA